jgi:hypothetical protein
MEDEIYYFSDTQNITWDLKRTETGMFYVLV